MCIGMQLGVCIHVCIHNYSIACVYDDVGDVIAGGMHACRILCIYM